MKRKNEAIENYLNSYQENLKISSFKNKLNIYSKIIFLLLLTYVVIVFTTIELLKVLG